MDPYVDTMAKRREDVLENVAIEKNRYFIIPQTYIIFSGLFCLPLDRDSRSALFDADRVPFQLDILIRQDRYYAVPQESSQGGVPYGFKLVKEFERGRKRYGLYENENFLPLGITFDRYVCEYQFHVSFSARIVLSVS